MVPSEVDVSTLPKPSAVAPVVREGMPVKICLPVPSLVQSRMKAAASGGALDAKEDEWQAGGFRACDGYDPEGNVVQFRESAAAP